MSDPLPYHSRKPDQTPDANIICPKCTGPMSRGFLIDRGDHNIGRQAVWIEGLPEISFWTGLKTRNRLKIPVITFRCQSCGFLEFYAPPISPT